MNLVYLVGVRWYGSPRSSGRYSFILSAAPLRRLCRSVERGLCGLWAGVVPPLGVGGGAHRGGGTPAGLARPQCCRAS